MASLEMTANAKINLSLDVLRKREDGYHELRTIMQSVELHDTVILETGGTGIRVECDSGQVPENADNIAARAAAMIIGRFGIKSGLRIKIIKRIPVAAGMAGGSADAAAVLRGLNLLFSIGLDAAELRDMGRRIGADVPYCVTGGTMLAEGIGERLTPLKPFSGVNLVIVKPDIGVSTAWAFQNLDLSKPVDRPDTELLAAAVENGDIAAVASNMRNVLESVTIPRYGIVDEAKKRLLELGALGSMMSGSGPSVFGMFADRDGAYEAYKAVASDRRWSCLLTSTK
jgi:4-diphosphocytidyl-2-C-methyl-D-erythritol kinase